MALLYVFNLFSFIGVVGILFYLIIEHTRNAPKADKYDRQSDKLDRLERYVYELEQRLQSHEISLSEEELRAKIIKMYDEGKELMYIEQALEVPRAKIDMVLKFHKFNQKSREN